MYHLLMYIIIDESVADAEVEFTLQVAAHLLIPTILPILWFSLCVPILYQAFFFSNHQPSSRMASRTKSRRRRVDAYYHLYKTRNRWKRKRSFRQPGRRDLGMRGVPVIRISRYRKLFDRSTLIHAMFFLVKLVCYCEMAMRLMLPYVMPFPIGKTLRLTLSHLIRLYERVCVPYYGMPYPSSSRSSP